MTSTGLSGFLAELRQQYEDGITRTDEGFAQAAGIDVDSPVLSGGKDLFKLHTGVDWADGPARSGRPTPTETARALWRYVQARPNARKLEKTRVSGVPDEVLHSVRGRRIRWMRKLEDAEAARPWVVSADVNGQYLAAAASVSLGTGEPVHRAAPAFDKKLPGYWHVTMTEPAKCHYHGLFDKPGWYPTPIVALAAEIPATIEISESWVWTEHYRWLAHWQADVRDARTRLLADHSPEAGAARNALKAVYSVFLGGWLAGERNHSELFRPDWRDAIQALATANMLRALHKAVTRPFMILEDAAYWTAPAASVLPNGLTFSEQPGKWKPHRQAAMDEVVRQAIATGRTEVARKAIKHAHEERVTADVT